MSFPQPPDGPRWSGPPPAGPPPSHPPAGPPPSWPPAGPPPGQPVGAPQGQPPHGTPAWPPTPPPPPPSGGVPRWLWVYGAVVAIVLVGLGAWVVLELRDPAAPDPVDLAAVGCTADTPQADLGGGHLGPEELANSAPSLIYPDQPPSSGPHIAQVVRSGVYDVVVDPRITTHNLEHGYVVVWYDVDTSPEDLAALRDWAEAGLAGDHPKLVVAQYPIRLPEDADVALTAWFRSQSCTGFDAAAADAFLRAHYDTVGEAPERGLPPHVSSGSGVLDPEGRDLLLPPLDDVN